jgi:phytoene dehydrogenase-like protein
MEGAGRQVTVVGGGIAGLVAAIHCAQQDSQVHLHEATGKLGGRARSADGPYVANYGPHALYGDGPFYAWLRKEKLLPRLARPNIATIRVRVDGHTRRMPRSLILAALRLRGAAPADLDYRTWASERVGEDEAEAAIGFVSLPTFHHDPGELSAAFAQERFHRLVFAGNKVRYVIGGWSSLIDKLTQRATDLGVQIETNSRVAELPQPPVILAVPLSAARGLLPHRELHTEGTRVVLLDIAVRSSGRSPRGVIDLTQRLYVTRTTGPDRTLAPAGEDLIQASAGLRPSESIEQATERIETVIDAGFPGWRDQETWRRRSLAENASGAIDLPGHTWQDRPALDQGNGIYLAGDAVAAPGLLSEVSYNSASEAAKLVTGKCAGRTG